MIAPKRVEINRDGLHAILDWLRVRVLRVNDEDGEDVGTTTSGPGETLLATRVSVASPKIKARNLEYISTGRKINLEDESNKAPVLIWGDVDIPRNVNAIGANVKGTEGGVRNPNAYVRSYDEFLREAVLRELIWNRTLRPKGGSQVEGDVWTSIGICQGLGAAVVSEDPVFRVGGVIFAAWFVHGHLALTNFIRSEWEDSVDTTDPGRFLFTQSFLGFDPVRYWKVSRKLASTELFRVGE